jgi:hypothetical protein
LPCSPHHTSQPDKKLWPEASASIPIFSDSDRCGATTLSSKTYLQQLLTLGKTDLYLTPPIQDHQLLELEAYRELYDIGYRYAKERLAEWVMPGGGES